MKMNSFKTTAGATALVLAGWLASMSMHAQPLYDRIHVNLPYTITLANKTLQPGDYTIQQLPSTGGDSRVLLFYSKDGMKFETSAMTIPALDPNTARDTKLVLNHVGDDYYISKIWVQGKDYGYELPIPNSIKSRQNERMTETTVAGNYSPSSSTDVTTTTAQNTTSTTTTTPDTSANTNTTPTETAQNTQPVMPPANSANNSATADNNANNNSADRAMNDQTPSTPSTDTTANNSSTNNGSANRSMPSTAAGWLSMLLSGGALSGAGMMLRRKR